MLKMLLLIITAMNKKSVNFSLAILLAGAAILNFQGISAGTSEKLLKSKGIVTKADLPRILSETVDYPSQAMYRELQGTVKVLAVIEPNGKVSGVRILEDIGGNCAGEVSRTIRKMHFIPYMENGIAIKHALVVSVNFKLEK
jgi:TonB family protein